MSDKKQYKQLVLPDEAFQTVLVEGGGMTELLEGVTDEAARFRTVSECAKEAALRTGVPHAVVTTVLRHFWALCAESIRALALEMNFKRTLEFPHFFRLGLYPIPLWEKYEGKTRRAHRLKAVMETRFKAWVNRLPEEGD